MPATVGRYELGDRVSSDAMSRTHRAVATTGLADAVHVRIAQIPELSAPLRQRFEEDARASALLAHENIVPLLDSGLHEGAPYVVVPPVETNTLREMLAREAGRRLPPEAVASIGLDVASALAYAHEHEPPVVHRALSPDAVVVDGGGVARIASFVLPSLFVQAASMHSHLLEHTCRYNAPEQAKNQRVSAASDVFALGVTLYEALAGKPAFDAPTPLATILKITMGVHVSLDLAAPSAPAKLRALVTRMLAVNEADRPRAADVRSALAELAGDEKARRAAVAKLVRVAESAPAKPAASTTPAPSKNTEPSSPRGAAPAPSDAPAIASAPARAAAPAPAVASAPSRAAAPPPAVASPWTSEPAPPWTASATDARSAPPPRAHPAPPPARVAPSPSGAWADERVTMTEDLPSEPTRFDAKAPEDVFGEELDTSVTDLPGEATSWDTQVPDAPLEPTRPDVALPEDREEEDAPRPLTVEKTVQIAMPAATAALFADRPKAPIAPPPAAPAVSPDEGRPTRPLDPAVFPSDRGAEPGSFRSPYDGPSLLLLVAIGVGAVATVALVAVLAIWLA